MLIIALIARKNVDFFLISLVLIAAIHHFPTYVLDIVTTHIYCKNEA